MGRARKPVLRAPRHGGDDPAWIGDADRSDSSYRRVVVVTGGGPLRDGAVASARAAGPRGERVTPALIVGADSGLDHARAGGLDPGLLVGDLDSISPAGLAWARANCQIQRHDPDKGATDTELAIAAALSGGADELVVLTGDGDRIDHQLATIGAVGRAALQHPTTLVSAWVGATRLHYVHAAAPIALSLPPGTTFSLLALDGTVTGVDISGARWPLADATLDALSGLGVSNIAVADPVIVSLTAGVAAVVIPDLARAPHEPDTPTGGSR